MKTSILPPQFDPILPKSGRAKTPFKVAGPRAVYGELFTPDELNYEFKSSAQLRPAFGDFWEVLSMEFMNCYPLKTDSRCDICPDLLIKSDYPTYGECKSVGKNRSVIVYKARRDKEITFFNQGNDYYYILFLHNAEAKRIGDYSEFLDDIAKGNVDVCFVPLSKIVDATLEKDPKEFTHLKKRAENPRAGWNRGGYEKGGWLLPVKGLTSDFITLKRRTLEIFGRKFIISLKVPVSHIQTVSNWLD
jgi:hypothetical protein